MLLGNKWVPETIEEVLSPPTKTAVIVVDLQNDFCHPEGYFGRAGAGMSMYPKVIENANRVITAAERAGAHVFYTVNTSLPGLVSDSPAQLRLALRAYARLGKNVSPSSIQYTVEGSWGQELVSGLYVTPDATVVKKHRSSGFIGTNLDLLLRSNGITTTVIVGCTTEGCVDSTARDAGFFDYFSVVIEDAVGTSYEDLHHAVLGVLRAYRADVITTDQLLRAWDLQLNPETISNREGNTS